MSDIIDVLRDVVSRHVIEPMAEDAKKEEEMYGALANAVERKDKEAMYKGFAALAKKDATDFVANDIAGQVPVGKIIGGIVNNPAIKKIFIGKQGIDKTVPGGSDALEAFAKKLEEGGASVEEIWQRAGKGNLPTPKGEIFSEISDSAAKLLHEGGDDAIRKLSEVLHHPQLFEAYPSLKDVPIKFIKDVEDSAYKFSKATGQEAISVGQNSLDKKGSLIHEIQHAIQNREDWEGGGSVAAIYNAFINKRKEFSDAINANMTKLAKGGLSPKEYDAIEEHSNKLIEVLQSNKWSDKGLREKAYDSYKKLFGEAQARLADKRSDLSQEAGRVKYPFTGGKVDDVYITDLIYHNKGG